MHRFQETFKFIEKKNLFKKRAIMWRYNINNNNKGKLLKLY